MKQTNSIDAKIRHWNHKRIDYMRAFKLKLSNFLFSPFNKIISAPANAAVLVLRLDDKLGDSITATGFLAELKNANPQSKLVVISGAGTAEVYRNLSFLDEVLVGKKGILSTLKLYSQLSKQSYKLIINTSHILNPRVLFLMSFLKSERKIGFENTDYKIFTSHLKIDFKKDHIVDRYKNLLALTGAKPTGDLQYIINRPKLNEIDELLTALRHKYKYIIALNSFAGGKLRNLNEFTTTEIVKKITAQIENSVVISLANEGDHNILKNWMADKNLNLAWKHYPQYASLNQNIAFASQADLVVTPDTAWVHIASALQKKLVAIYREDTYTVEMNSVIWAPYKTEFITVKASATGENPDDINNVNVDEVVKAAQDLLKS